MKGFRLRILAHSSMEADESLGTQNLRLCSGLVVMERLKRLVVIGLTAED